MPRVEFFPSGKYTVVDETALISEAARRAGISIYLPCGGKGTCKRCLVKVLEGRVVQYEKPAEAMAQNVVLACKTAVGVSDCRIELNEYDFSRDDSIDITFDDEIPDTFTDSNPLVRACVITVPAPKPDDGFSDLDRVNNEIRNHTGITDISWELSAIRLLPDSLRAENGAISAMLYHNDTIAHVCDIKKTSAVKGNFGIAIDLGTTTVSVAIIDIESKKIMGCATGYNEQISCGEDVISRINYARSADNLEELRTKAVATINRLIAKILTTSHISEKDVYAAVISGNTTMMHLLLGIKPEYLRLDPYTPACMNPGMFRAADIGLSIHPAAQVYFSPAVGSYVGGDITAGILCADFYQRDEIALFIDVGTNGEIVLGNREFLFTCACSAGPAFEGGGISCGMRAMKGAISAIEIDRNTAGARFSVIGGGKPKGICGSGIIELLSELLYKGWMDRMGKLVRDVATDAISVDGRKACFRLVAAQDSAIEKDIWITEQDIENVLRAKAAVFSAVATLLDYAGLSFIDIAKIYIAGGFGRFLNINHAITIGLFPELPLERYIYLGNASLKGSLMLLSSHSARELQKTIASKMTYINLSSQSGYAENYTAALFFPHTDETLFPDTIKKCIR